VELVNSVLVVVWCGVLLMAGYALIHGAIQRADAYTAADKMTKNTWLAILGGATLLALATNFIGLGVTGSAIAAVAAGVYLADVRPKLLEVQGKSR
jgi:hypothetical protein